MSEFVDSVRLLFTGNGLDELSQAIEAFRETKGLEELADLRVKSAQIALACNKALERVEHA